jgi:SAM-dependent methyltransferase/DNA-binding CsgD family transcriptional regulator
MSDPPKRPIEDEIQSKREDAGFQNRVRRRVVEDLPVLDRLAAGPEDGIPNPEREKSPPFDRVELELLTDRDREVLEMRYGIWGESRKRYSLAEIGERLGITRERVRQIQNGSLRRLQQEKEKKISEAGSLARVSNKVSRVGTDATPAVGDAATAYNAMAPVYDDFTDHHKYELWLGQVLPRLEASGLTGNRLLDAACGTGKSFLPMLDRGWEVTGRDISPAMIEVARTKVSDETRLGVADMRNLPVLGEFDLVWALADAVNYLTEPEDLALALAALGRNLAPTGLLLVDTNTLHTYRTFFAEDAIVERDECRLVWTGKTDPLAQPGVLADAIFEVEPSKPGGLRIAPTLHRERHYPEALVRQVIEQAGLVVLDVFGHHYDAIPRQPVDELTDIKVIYIAARAVAEA